jgi:ATP-dependent DNA helicase RecQ
MEEYVGLSSGHMESLIRALDGDPGTLSTPALPPLPATTSPALVREAEVFLRRTDLPIEPRQRWPAGGLPSYGVTGSIPPELRAQPGRALAVWGDAGWGGEVRQGKYVDGRFSDELVRACAALVRRWDPRPVPLWVTCIPSRRHPDLVPDLARRLAAALSLPCCEVLEKTGDRPQQKTMANSTQQARNVDGSLAIKARPLPEGPVLLVDDLVDSRWTLAVASWLLRSHDSGEVWPLALAWTGHDS